jgi:hypothetical protein
MTSGTLADREGTGPVVRDTSRPKQFVVPGPSEESRICAAFWH